MSCRPGLSCPSAGLRTESGSAAAEAQAERFASPFTREPMQAVAGPLARLLSMPSLVPSVGAPLPGHVRSGLEQRSGVDLSSVRVHSQPTDLAARRGNDRALSVGRDIVLGSPPPLPGPQRALAHEIGHVVQRGGGGRGLTDLSGKSGLLVQGDGGLTDQDAQLIRDWLVVPGTAGTGPEHPQENRFGAPLANDFPPMRGLTLTFPLPGRTPLTREGFNPSQVTVCNTNCHQSPAEQREAAARRAKEAHQAALRRAWPGLHRTQSTPELDKQGRSIQDDVDSSRTAEGQFRVQMFDAAMGSGQRSSGMNATRLDERVRDSWMAAEQAAVMIEAVYRAAGTAPVPAAVIDPLRPWFIAFYASVSRIFRQLDTNDKRLAYDMGRAQFPARPAVSASAQACPGGCHAPSSPGLRALPDLFASAASPPFGHPVVPFVLLDTAPGPRETR